MDNSERFINAYNRLDKMLRSLYYVSVNASFTDMIRRTAQKNFCIKSNETALVDFGRLRNAIVHNGTPEIVIAEPHVSVVERLEKIVESISRPPKALDFFGPKDVTSVSPETPLLQAVSLVYKSGYSNLPVFDGAEIKGVLGNKTIVNALGKAVKDGREPGKFLKLARVGDILTDDYGIYYKIAGASATIDEVLMEFSANKKLTALLITQRGTRLEKPVCIITVFDLMSIYSKLEEYR